MVEGGTEGGGFNVSFAPSGSDSDSTKQFNFNLNQQ